MKNLKIILALCVGLPSSLLGIFWLVYYLTTKSFIKPWVSLLLMVLVGLNTIYLLIYYGFKNKR